MHGYFVAELHCPVCGNVSGVDNSTEMREDLEIQDDRASLFLAPGARFEMIRPGPTRAGFFARTANEPEAEMSLLQNWECPVCGTDPLWAAIHLVPAEDADPEHRYVRIESIRAVPRTSESLAAADYVRYEIVEDLEARLGAALTEGENLVPDHLARLGSVLPLDRQD